ncbi:MAG: hypothetical protein ACRDOG_07430, partial [Gaiellaceae bacterium]
LALPGVGSAQPASARMNVWVVGDGGGDVSVGRRARLGERHPRRRARRRGPARRPLRPVLGSGRRTIP